MQQSGEVESDSYSEADVKKHRRRKKYEDDTDTTNDDDNDDDDDRQQLRRRGGRKSLLHGFTDAEIRKLIRSMKKFPRPVDR